MTADDLQHRSLGRRELLRGTGVLGLGALVGARPSARYRLPFDRTTPVGLPPSCVLTPAVNPGPYWLPLTIPRRDVTEGLAGMPMSVYLRVVRESDCSPVANAVIDYWQADSEGLYSGVAALGTSGETWLRGYQRTQANGLLRFDSIYPGWYPVRTTHLHVKVFASGSLFDTQLYLPDSFSQAVYRTGVYAARGPKLVANVDDPLWEPATVAAARTFRTSLSGTQPRGAPQRILVGKTLVLDV